MRVVVVSHPDEHANEIAVVRSLFVAGLERYHLRKPSWDMWRMTLWLEKLPARWRSRIVLHSHHELAMSFRLSGIHFPDDGSLPDSATPDTTPESFISRSCHDPACVKAALGRCDSLFFGPVLPSLSKPGYGPVSTGVLDELRAVLAGRTQAQMRTTVFAVGGITARGLGMCRRLGFDGVAALGGIWGAPDPVVAFLELQAAARARAGDDRDDRSLLQ